MKLGLSDLFFTISTRLFVILPGLVIQGILARWLGPDGRGEYAVCLTYIAFLTVVGIVGLDVACQYFLASRRLTVSEAVCGTMLLTTIGGAIAIVIGYYGLQLPWRFFLQASRSSFLTALAVVPTQIWCASLLLARSAVRSFRTYNALTCIETILRLLVVGIAVAFLSFGVHGALVANGVSALITAVLVLRHLRRQFELRWTPPPTEIIGKLVGYGARYYIGALGVMAGAHIGTMVLASVSTSNEVGLFGAAAALIMQLTLLPDALATVIHPRIADDPAGRPDLTAMCGRIVGILCGAMYLAIALFASPIATLIFGGEFQQVADPLRILALGGWIRSVARVFVPFLNATNRPGIGAWATAAGVAVNLALIGPWYRTHGLIGAAWAVTIAYILHAGIVSWAFCRFARMGVASAFLPRRQDVFAMAEAVRRIRRGNES